MQTISVAEARAVPVRVAQKLGQKRMSKTVKTILIKKCVYHVLLLTLVS
jgi:hypothetical protein